MNKPITVITICYNAADVLPLTIESVLAQDYDNYEYVIEDGESTDGTSGIIEKYRERFESKGISFIYNRKPDGGIYDAMNKGVEASSGDYINFMNAGDCFYSSRVLGRIADVIGSAGDAGDLSPDVIYGDCAVYEYGRFYMFGKSIEHIRQSMPFSHQSAFAKRELLAAHPFVTDYRYSADYDFLLTVHDMNGKFTDAGIMVCIATADGLTSVHYRDTLIETRKIQSAHGIAAEPKTTAFIGESILRLKQFVLDHFPLKIRKCIRDLQIRSRGQELEPVIPFWFSNHIRSK